MSTFDGLKLGPPSTSIALHEAYQLDDSSLKVDLGVAHYRREKDKLWVLPCVQKAEKLLANDEMNYDFLPTLGYEPFCTAAMKLLLGDDCEQIVERKAFSVQCLGASGSLRLALEFMERNLGYKTILVSSPTWEVYNLISKCSGFNNILRYRYWNTKLKTFDIEGMLEDLRSAPSYSVIILQACAHNPTGCDPRRSQWQAIADCLKEKKLFPLFDSAFQGLATGDVDADAWAVRYFVKNGFELMCAQGFSKSFGIHNERIGNLTVVVNSTSVLEAMKYHFTILVSGMYLSPPSHGAKLVAKILTTASLREEWKDCVKMMFKRIKGMRNKLKERLDSLGTPGDWDCITTQIGLFTYTGLSEPQIDHMKDKYHLYMLKSGRMNMGGLNMDNIDHAAHSIDSTIKTIPTCGKY